MEFPTKIPLKLVHDMILTKLSIQGELSSNCNITNKLGKFDHFGEEILEEDKMGKEKLKQKNLIIK